MKNTTYISIFASGSGSNAENIILHFKNHPRIKINHIFCNKPNAFVLERAKNLRIDSTLFSKADLYDSDVVLEKLKTLNTDWIVLSGFLWLTPKNLVENFKNKIINIHPALLPKYGGKGMYGNYVHEAIVANKETETGITIHFVNEKYDEGKIILQAKTKLFPSDSSTMVAQKVHKLEYEYFPKTIEKVILESYL